MEEIEISASTGNVAALQKQLARWEAEVADESIIQKDHLPLDLEDTGVYHGVTHSLHR